MAAWRRAIELSLGDAAELPAAARLTWHWPHGNFVCWANCGVASARGGAMVSAAAATTIAAKAAKAPIATVSVIDSKVLEFPGWFRIPISSSSRECQEVAERGSFSIILTSSSRPAERVAGGRPWSKRGINRPLCHLCGRNARPRHTRLLDKRCRVVRAMLFLGDAAQLLFVLCTLGYLACAGVVNGAAPALQSLWGSRLRVCEAGVAGFECRRNQRP